MNSLKEWLSANRDGIIKPVTVLFCICLVISLALAAANAVTAPTIEQLTLRQQQEAMSGLIPGAEFEELELTAEDGLQTCHAAYIDGALAGYIFIETGKGYGGDVSVMAAIDPQGAVIAVDILDVSNETPGLGQNAAREGFYSKYAGKTAGITVVKNGAISENNEVDAVTGATITSRAVTSAVNAALEHFELVQSDRSEAGTYE